MSDYRTDAGHEQPAPTREVHPVMTDDELRAAALLSVDGCDNPDCQKVACRQGQAVLRVLDELDELAAWKAAAMEVEREWDCQAVAKMLGVPLGHSCRKGIAARLPAVLKELAELKDMERNNTYRRAYEHVDSVLNVVKEERVRLADRVAAQEKLLRALTARCGQQSEVLTRLAAKASTPGIVSEEWEL